MKRTNVEAFWGKIPTDPMVSDGPEFVIKCG